MAEVNKKESVFKKVSKWFREMRSELKKVVWPDGKKVLKNTLIVIACSIVIGVFVWGFDAVAGLLVNGIIKLFGAAV